MYRPGSEEFADRPTHLSSFLTYSAGLKKTQLIYCYETFIYGVNCHES